MELKHLLSCSSNVLASGLIAGFLFYEETWIQKMATWQGIKIKALEYLEGFSYFCSCGEQGLSELALEQLPALF